MSDLLKQKRISVRDRRLVRLVDYDLLLGMTSERCTQLEQERDEARLLAKEAQRNLSQYENVHQISSTDIKISDVKLGGGSYGGK